MTTRARFLGRVRAEMAKTRGLVPAAAARRPSDALEAAALVRRQLAERWPQALDRFREELERVSGFFHRVGSPDDAAGVIGRIAREREARRVVAWSPAALGWDPAPGLAREGLEAAATPHEPVGAEEALRLREIAAGAEIGVTAADLAIAETGSLVLFSGAGKPRSASLLPPFHVAVFGKGALVETLEQAGVIFEALHLDPGRNFSGASITFISGPSRTADIELTLTRGVHGPKEVHAIFVDSL